VKVPPEKIKPAVVRLRPKNQITLPNSLVERLGLEPDDYLEVCIGPRGGFECVPARFVRSGTREAAAEERQVDAELAAGDYQSFSSVESALKALDAAAAGANLETKAEAASFAEESLAIHRQLEQADLAIRNLSRLVDDMRTRANAVYGRTGTPREVRRQKPKTKSARRRDERDELTAGD